VANPTALLVCSDPDDTGVLAAGLDFLGYFPVHAIDASEAMLAILNDRPQLIVLDAELNGVSGWATCEVLKRHAATRHIPVVMITPTKWRHHELKASESGADLTHGKPIDVREFTESVRQHMSSQGVLIIHGTLLSS
jgi:DNA-binding response OmpR family regulator